MTTKRSLLIWTQGIIDTIGIYGIFFIFSSVAFMGTILQIFFAVTDVLTSKLARFPVEITTDLQQNISYKQKKVYTVEYRCQYYNTFLYLWQV